MTNIVKNINVYELLSRLRLHFLENDLTRKYANEQPPLRAELFNAEQLAHYGEQLASAHQLKKGYTRDRLLKRLASNERILIEVRNLLSEAIKDNSQITPAGEWLLDNFYLIEDNIHTGKRHLPRGYSESLPKLANTSSMLLPRVYDIALEMTSHTDGRIDLDSLRAFVTSYQKVTDLQIGELWAVPIMLRLALIENLRRVSVHVAIDRVNQNLAGYWAKTMIETAERDPRNLILVIADMVRSGPPLEGSFVAELIRQLIWKGPSLALPLTWMEQRLAEKDLTTNELVNIENQKQAADQVTISNSINSLRSLGSIDWKEFVEEMSATEKVLREDPLGAYTTMDFATRDDYRHKVEYLAKYSQLPEKEVAATILKMSREEAVTGDEKKRHVGYYLVGDGLNEAEKQVRSALPAAAKMKRMLKKMPLFFYSGSIGFISLIITTLLLLAAFKGHAALWLMILTSVVSFLAATYFATSFVNWVTTILYKPGLLPRMDLSKGIPKELSALVVVPTMLITKEQVADLADMLEVRFLVNRDKNLHFGLLTDLMDADAEHLPGDNELETYAQAKIEELNDRYAESGDKFFLFHRPRKWNVRDKLWMGYERKRGKLSELNALLRGRGEQFFSKIVGDTTVLPDVKYVITLDTDTQLPHDSAWKMVGTMAHPLNKPVFDQKKQRIVKGYGILQPRVSVSLSRTGNSLYSLMLGNEAGVDPYTRLTSDVYQDLFSEGSFIGKGIYDVDAFETALNGRFPENRILSHDLLEGCYVRSGLLTDVQVYEEYPLRYSTDVNRRHRWIRGDWQIGTWTLPMVPGSDGKFKRNNLSFLSRWKIFDNLRRSAEPVALTTLVILGWFAFSDPWFWTLAVILILLLQPAIDLAWRIFHKSNELTIWQHVRSLVVAAADDLFRHAFLFVCLPYEAYFSVDAIIRTWWRIAVSHRRLLEWRVSGRQERTSERTLWDAYRSMWFSLFISICCFFGLSWYSPVGLITAGPVLIIWGLSPFIAWWVSKPIKKREVQLEQDQVIFLRRIARKTWGFFESFVTPADNWLPPDNFQENPRAVVAHRTSPTNIGIAMLSNLAAHDFGYISILTLLTRLDNTFQTLKKLERYKGHLYNWYDTVTLQPLHPRYISAVDSGNIAGHLLTLKQGLLALRTDKIKLFRLFEGLHDAAQVVLKEIPGDPLVLQLVTNLDFASRSAPLTPTVAHKYIEVASKYIAEIQAGSANGSADTKRWVDTLKRQFADVSDELQHLFPWASLGTPSKELSKLYHSLTAHSLEEIASIETDLQAELSDLHDLSPTDHAWLEAFKGCIAKAAQHASERLAAIDELVPLCDDFADIEYDFLYDRSKHLLAIGYNAEDHKRDGGYYDLLASEASLATYVGIAQGKLSHESWFALGRLLTHSGGTRLLLSWSGSMFEYLMPMLVMPDYENTLLAGTHKSAVARQVKYGAEQGVPWGISESCYNGVDANLVYQYRAFGVPGLGLKRGLSEDLVIAPYASALALMVAPYEACRNMERLSAEGMEGKYGLYESADYTQSRVPRGQDKAIVQTFMAHHQGMSLLSIAYALLDKPMQKRFESELQFRSALLLLQERVPRVTSFYTYSAEVAVTSAAPAWNTEMRVISTANTPVPEVQLLSNGRYHVMISNAGGGYSKWRDMAVTRWQEDSTCDNWGTFCYIRDLESGYFWSNTYQPTLKQPKSYEATFTQGKAEFRRSDNNIETYTEVVVSPEDDIEIRRVSITNRNRRAKRLEITSYAEVVLTSGIADQLHPAFSKLFITTEIMKDRRAILCQRRPRAAGQRSEWMFHMMAVHGADEGPVSYETDRAKFMGRGNLLVSPAAMKADTLSNTDGAVLDPIVAIRHTITAEPEQAITVDIISGACATREECIALLEKYQEKYHKDRVFELSWTHSQVVLRQINAVEADAQLYGQLAGSVLYTDPYLRTNSSLIAKNRKNQSGLWGYSISGDLPIVLLEISSHSNLDLVKQMVQAHTYWRLKGVSADLVILNEDNGGYRQNLQNDILGLMSAGASVEFTERPGSVFVRVAEQLSDEDRTLIKTVARAVISDKQGTLADQVRKKNEPRPAAVRLVASRSYTPGEPTPVKQEVLSFFNGMGGFTQDGREYVILLAPGAKTPMPWVNVLANPLFGTVVSESGQSYTWMDNAHEMRLTPWGNDPMCDRGGETFYIRDEETGYYWSPTPLPAPGTAGYKIRHGFGYSVFEHDEGGILSEMWIYTDIDAPVKFFMLKVKNTSRETRNLSATGYIEWVLGDMRSRTSMYIVTEKDPAGALLATNYYSQEFAGQTGFFDTDSPGTFTCDRTEFIGRNKNLVNPDGLTLAGFSGRMGAGIDPCAALQTAFRLAPGEARVLVFRLGSEKSVEEAKRTAGRFKGIKVAEEALEKVIAFWSGKLGKVQVETPDKALNTLANGWLMYQVIASRLWARSGYYQSGGAYGFRDQLQDVLAVLQTSPEIARKQILLAASRQFVEGDVQHWWHPPLGRGVRTTCSDDLLWLPYVVCNYVTKTGETTILEEPAGFLEGRPLEPHEHSYYDLPTVSQQTGAIYQHCVKAIEHALKFGEHGLPLIGSGDWNDGMDMVGKDGNGESVWLGFFLYEVLTSFADVAKIKQDDAFADKCLSTAKELQINLQKNGWDGEWYRRAYFDDGTPLGSAGNTECRIDSISQSWAVLSGGGDQKMVRKAINAADTYLVNTDDDVIKLLDPPFDRSALNPGYIKGYIPGIRENGGQYTHAAIWLIMAHVALGNTKRAWQLTAMINPINHGDSAKKIQLYKTEPYVMAADVYSAPPNQGHGGWTWYTGSAGWMYQLIIEWLLGIQLKGNKLTIEPHIPGDWETFSITYHYHDTPYEITVQQQGDLKGSATIELDGNLQDEPVIVLTNDKTTHKVLVNIHSESLSLSK